MHDEGVQSFKIAVQFPKNRVADVANLAAKEVSGWSLATSEGDIRDSPAESWRMWVWSVASSDVNEYWSTYHDLLSSPIGDALFDVLSKVALVKNRLNEQLAVTVTFQLSQLLYSSGDEDVQTFYIAFPERFLGAIVAAGAIMGVELSSSISVDPGHNA